MNTPSKIEDNMEIDSSPKDSEKQRAVSELRSESRKRNQGSSPAGTRRIITPRRANLKRVSSPSLHDQSGTKRPTAEAQDPRLANKYFIDAKPPYVVNIEKSYDPFPLPSNAGSVDPQVPDPRLANLPGQESRGFRSSPAGKYGIIAFE